MLPERLQLLANLLAGLPGVGPKSAQRFAFHLASSGQALATDLGAALSELAAHIGSCQRCGSLAERDPEQRLLCTVCRDPRRNATLMCIVARQQDVLALERSGAVNGRYFVLGRLLSPLDGVGAEDLPLTELRNRIQEDGVTEVIIATPPSVDGEATALLIAQELQALDVQLSRIASGLPHGGELEFADQITLGRAIAGRQTLGER